MQRLALGRGRGRGRGGGGGERRKLRRNRSHDLHTVVGHGGGGGGAASPPPQSFTLPLPHSQLPALVAAVSAACASRSVCRPWVLAPRRPRRTTSQRTLRTTKVQCTAAGATSGSTARRAHSVRAANVDGGGAGIHPSWVCTHPPFWRRCRVCHARPRLPFSPPPPHFPFPAPALPPCRRVPVRGRFFHNKPKVVRHSTFPYLQRGVGVLWCAAPGVQRTHLGSADTQHGVGTWQGGRR
jgi:hypothetical protein